MAANPAEVRTGTRNRSTLEMAAFAVAATFLVVGVLGFVPGITQDFDQLEFAGPDSRAMLLGLFQVSVLHNAVHLLFGFAGLAARGAVAARTYLIGGGGIYGVLWIYGMVVDQMSDANFVPVNTADNWLHFGLAAGMILLGVILGPSTFGSPGGTRSRQSI
jgi:hypothetical protein